MSRSTRRALLFAVAAIGLAAAGCGDGRPPGIANQPGDNFVELTEVGAEGVEGEFRVHVHYRFPDELPHPDSWFQFYFEINDGQSGATLVRKQGRELNDEGDITTTASLAFVKRRAIRVAVRVQQSKNKNGPWHDVSERISVDGSF